MVLNDSRIKYCPERAIRRHLKTLKQPRPVHSEHPLTGGKRESVGDPVSNTQLKPSPIQPKSRGTVLTENEPGIIIGYYL